MHDEFEDIIKQTLKEHADDGQGNQANLSSPVYQDFLAKKLCDCITARFHVLATGSLQAG